MRHRRAHRACSICRRRRTSSCRVAASKGRKAMIKRMIIILVLVLSRRYLDATPVRQALAQDLSSPRAEQLAAKEPLVPYSPRYRALLRARFSLFSVLVMAAVLPAYSTHAAPPPAEVSAAQVVVKPVRHWDEFTGRVAAPEAVEMRARVSGYIDPIAFKEAHEVKSGDLLFVIDPRPYKAAYDSAAAQLERAQAAARLAEVLDQRSQSLIKTGAISRNQYDRSNSTRAPAAPDVHAGEAALAMAKLNLGFTEVGSPLAGPGGTASRTVAQLVQADQSEL